MIIIYNYKNTKLNVNLINKYILTYQYIKIFILILIDHSVLPFSIL